MASGNALMLKNSNSAAVEKCLNEVRQMIQDNRMNGSRMQARSSWGNLPLCILPDSFKPYSPHYKPEQKD